MRPCMASSAQDDDIWRNHLICCSHIADGVNFKGVKGIFLSIKFASAANGALQLMTVFLPDRFDEPPNERRDLTCNVHRPKLSLKF